MADVKAIAETLVNLTVKEVEENTNENYATSSRIKQWWR